MLSALNNHWQKTLDVLLPPLCVACDTPVGADRTLCPACWQKIHFIAPPFCACCGLPFDIPVEDGALCGRCLEAPAHYAAARAAMVYDDASKNIILSFKHSDRTHPAKALAAWMLRAGKNLVQDADCLMPVPLHRWRLFKRRYNQAALLAQHMARLSGKQLLVDTLRRPRPTPPQGHMSRKERAENIRGAFAVHPPLKPLIQDKKIILIDDVLTTGATVNECSRVLREEGAKEVTVLALARVRNAA